jgi:molybdopterin molybdotransferase
MLEDAETDESGRVRIARAARAGQHVVGADDDFAVGAVLVEPGRPIGARELAALSAAGIDELAVWKRPRVAIISTGDEVMPPETTALQPGQVRDAIAPAVEALVRQAQGEPVRRGIVPDDEQALEAACRAALADCDIVVLSAGSSVGERDLTARVVERLGAPGIWCHGLAMRPGRPTLLADIAGSPVIGLPGNPLSALVVFELIGCPIVRRMAGLAHEPPRPITRAVLAHDVVSATGRVDVVQVRLIDGAAHALPKGSALISTLVRADGQLIVPEERDAMAAGEHVEVWLAAT